VPSLRDILTPKSRDAILQEIIDILRDRGFPVTDWHPGGVGRTLLEVDAAALEDLYALVPAIAAGGYLATAQGPWLDLLVESAYGLQRYPATFARGKVVLTAEPGFGPYTLQPGDLWVGTPDGLRYYNTTGGVLPRGGTLEVEVQAESPGSRYNVPVGAISILHTPLPGVSVTNAPGWLVEAARDEETDEELRRRARLRWASLGTGATRAAYEFWALNAHPAVTKVRVRDDHPRGQGTVDVVIWGEGGLGPDVVSAVDAYIQERRPLTADVFVYSAVPRYVNVRATIYVRAGYLTQAQAAVEEELTALQRDMPIGGTLYRSAIIEALFVRPYVVNVVLTQPTGDEVLGPTEALVLTQDLTWQEVVE
jgi:uncharacterized phage protein gp47/JayE